MAFSQLPSTPSSVALATLSSPPLKSPNPNESPNFRSSPSIPNNYHPYLIQTTSSSLLTRSNSSPSRPIAELRHKPSRSMSSLAASASESELDKVASGAGGGLSREEKERRRKSMESPLTRPGMRRSGTLPMFPRMEEVLTPSKSMDLPLDPKSWSPSELARYLANTLRTGGPDGTGQTLPGPLIKDIETWVLRQQVNGRAFLKGNQESWTSSSRPPPFLPLLLSISRRLRRSSLQSRLSSENASFSPSPLNSDMGRTGSVLFEEDEEDSGEHSPLSGVKRMANAYESHSTPDLGDEPEPLKAQWTGGSSTSEVWRRWEDMGVGVRRKRRESERSLGAGNLADEEVSPAAKSSDLSSGSGGEAEVVETPEEEEDEGAGGTVKAPPVGLGLGLGLSGGDMGGKGKQTSPPPPYRSPDPDVTPNHLPVPLGESVDTPPNRMRSSVTPTPERPRTTPMSQAAPSDDEATAEPSHMSNMSTHRSTGSDPYAALRQPSSGRKSTRRLPHDLQLDPSTDDSSATRRVTLRPNRVDSLFAPPSPPVKSPREAELENQLSALVSRVKELESKLDSVSDEMTSRKGGREEAVSPPASPTGREMVRPGTPVGLLPDSILVRLGLLPEREGLPVRIRELPGYLFLVGVGVGAVVVKVFMRRR